MENLAGEWPELDLVGSDLAGQRHAEHGAAVETAAEGDQAGAAGRRTGNLDGILDGFCAGVDEKRFLRRAARGGRIEPLAQLDVRLVGHHLEAGVGERFQLLARRSDHPGMAVAGIDHRDAGAEVDPATPFDIPDFRVLGPFGEQRRALADASRQRAATRRAISSALVLQGSFRSVHSCLISLARFARGSIDAADAQRYLISR
jgi:hypothetical protein